MQGAGVPGTEVVRDVMISGVIILSGDCQSIQQSAKTVTYHE